MGQVGFDPPLMLATLLSLLSLTHTCNTYVSLSQGLYKQFVEFLRGLGVEAVATVGTPFDPNFHEAIMREPNNEVEDNTVLMEFRKGFKLGDKLLRPAMVKVGGV